MLGFGSGTRTFVGWAVMADPIIPQSDPPKAVIETEEQATNYVVHLVAEMQQYRAACDVACEGPRTVQAVQRMAWAFLVKQGQVVGALNAFRSAGLLSERAWAELHQKAINALIPTVAKV